ncbi:MAG: hypothetical protein QNJ98_10550 [Planctomycetota bacterium]|nr:hypothetical protein [Planctomycetota bacterium]
MLRRGMTILLVLTLSACGSDDENGGQDKGGGTVGNAAGAKPGGAGGKPPAEKPAKRPALTEGDFTRISTRTLPGFTGSVSTLNAKRFGMVYVMDEKTPGGNKIAVHATLQPCDIGACFSMDPDHAMNKQWAKQAMEGLTKQGYESPVFEVGRFELAPGYTGFMHYQRGHKVQVLEGGRKSRSSTHGFNVRYDDGSNAVHLRIYAQGSVGAESVEDLQNAMPRTMAEDAARKVFGLYADLFEKGGS